MVTGASSGIGACCARQLAAMGADVIVTARRADRLEALAKEIEQAHGVKVTVVPVDLGAPGGAARLWEATEGAGRAVDVMVNNAGFGTQDPFVDIPWERIAEQLQLNVVSLTELTHRAVKAMLARGRGFVLNVASVGAYMPVPHYATYAAGKAYVRNFTEALAWELRRTQVHVCCLCPGSTATEFMQVAGHEDKPIYRLATMSAERCARIGLAALFRVRRNVVSGMTNKLGMFWLRFLPRRWIVAGAALVMAKPEVPAPRALPPGAAGPAGGP